MNIEEERKAFEDQCSDVLPSRLSATWDGEKYISQFSSSKPYLQACFEIWCKAKAHTEQVHAEEMHKPKCILEKADDGYAIRLSWRPGHWLKFASESDARTWAKANGYRVIE